jgi:hypothetical protein
LPQLVPSAALVHAVELVAGTQIWHGSFVFGLLAATNARSISQPLTHVPLMQNMALMHVVPSTAWLHADVLILGRQAWQMFAGFVAPAE